MIWRRRPLVSDDIADWTEAQFDWAEETFGADWAAARRLVLPTKAFFTAPSGRTPQVAQAIADDIARIIGMDPVPVEPIAQIDAAWRHSHEALSSVGGTWASDGTQYWITYDPDLMHRPTAFIALIAHEMMHARLAPVAHTLPGGAETEEPATDLHVITHGFGLFQLEGASELGWQGYLSQPTRAHALAVFLTRTGIYPREAMDRLGGANRRALARALKDLAG